MLSGRRRALAFGSAALLAGGAGVGLGYWVNQRAARASALESAAFTDLEGKTRRIGEWRGKVLAVNFWATWCAPCREEIPMLVEIRDSVRARGLEVLGIAIDNAAKVTEFTLKVPISYPVLIADGTGLALIRNLGNASGGLPFTVFVDRSGTPVRTKLGALTRAQALAAISDLLG